jgi:2-enoate reductase
MCERYAELFEPFTIRKLTLKNRFVMAPMSTCDNLGFHMSESMIRFCEERAKGGVSMIFTECQAVDKIDSMTSLYKTAGTVNQEKEWTNFNRRIKKYDVKTCCQLGCGAGRNSVNIPFGKALSSSRLPFFANPKKYTKEMTKKQIHELVLSFGKAAASAKRAGFDAVEIHAHTGYLLDQFISKCWNHRTDEYGGDAVNRARICVEIIEEIRKNVGEDYPVILRMSMDHRVEGERGPAETEELIRVLDKTSLDAFDVDLGSYDSDSWGVTPEYYGDAAALDAAKALRPLTDKVIFNAGTYTPDTALEAVSSGVVDVIMIGRSLIADPEYVSKIQADKVHEIRPCLRCNNYCIYHFFSLLPLSCAVNPQAASEEVLAIPHTKSPKKIAVVGGGPSGMEAAYEAARAGHQVVLYERLLIRFLLHWVQAPLYRPSRV